MTRPPRIVLLATLAFGVLTAFWSVLTPLTEAPDEPAHLGLVFHVAETGEYPAFDELQHSSGLFQMCVDYATSINWCRTDAERATNRMTRERPADEAPPKHGRVRWDDPDFQRPKPGRMNQMPQHPPLYYEAMAGALRVERALVPGELSVDTELAYLRLLNALLVLPLPWLAWLAARRLGAPPQVAAVASLLPLAVPQLTHIGGTLNNDNLFVVLASVLMALLAGVVRGDRTWRTAALVGLVTGLALLTKGFGVVLPPVVLLAYLVGWRRGLRGAVPAVGALALGFVVSGWWYLGNLASTGHVMPSIEDERLSPTTRPADFHPRIAEYAASAVSRLVEGFWGAFGWRRVELPTAVSAVATVACLAAVVLALRRPSPRARSDSGPAMGTALAAGSATVSDPPSVPGPVPPMDSSPVGRRQLAVLLAPMALLGAFVLVRSAVIYRDSGRLAFQQGRYLFAGLTAAGVVVAYGVVRALGARAVRATLAAALVLQGLAVLWCLDGWWGADGVPLGALEAVVAWSGWPNAIAIPLLALPLLPLGLLTHEAWRFTTDTPAGPPTRQPPQAPSSPTVTPPPGGAAAADPPTRPAPGTDATPTPAPSEVPT